MQADQTVAEMANETLVRQARARVRRTGEPFGAALRAVICTEAGQQLWKLRRGRHRYEKAAEWQKNLARERAEERISMSLALNQSIRLGL